MTVSLGKWEGLRERMARLGIRESDLDESFTRSSGPGGQHVNKVASCVQLVHRPTGTRVRCQRERTQADNRYRARVRLCEKIEEERLGRRSEARKKAEKIRRQKRRRSRRTKAKLLEQKRRRSETKRRRGTVDPDRE